MVVSIVAKGQCACVYIKSWYKNIARVDKFSLQFYYELLNSNSNEFSSKRPHILRASCLQQATNTPPYIFSLKASIINNRAIQKQYNIISPLHHHSVP